MAKRGKRGQAQHDGKVQERLESLKDEGYRVRADLPDRAKPPKVGGRIPDIYARKGESLVVEEIETPSTLGSDKKQHEQLKKGTEQLGGKFRIKVARKK